MTALILQARLDSSRLPGKSLLPLLGKPLVFRVMEALNFVEADIRILACPEDCIQDFGPIAEEAGFLLVAGPKEDVLRRYCIAIQRVGADRVIRATGDNPFVFADAATAINRESLDLKADYGAYQGLPVGAGVESVASEALLRADREAETESDREHVCPYLYAHPELFSLHRPLAPPAWQGAMHRITVDTQEDYTRAMALYSQLGDAPVERYNGTCIIHAYQRLFSPPQEPEA